MTARMGWVAGCLAWCWCATAALGQTETITENGQQYRVTRRTESRPRWSTEYRDTERVYQIPITEYALEPYVVNRWNPLATPYVAYRYVPRTRLELRAEKVRLPVTASRPVTVEVIEREALNTPATLPTAPGTPRTADSRNATAMPPPPGTPPAVARESGWRAHRPIGGTRERY